MSYVIYLIIIYFVASTIFKLLANTFFVMRLQKVNPSEVKNLGVNNYPFISAINITSYLSLDNHLKLNDEKLISLGGFLKKYYEKSWYFKAVYPSVIGVTGIIFILLHSLLK